MRRKICWLKDVRREVRATEREKNGDKAEASSGLRTPCFDVGSGREQILAGSAIEVRVNGGLSVMLLQSGLIDEGDVARVAGGMGVEPVLEEVGLVVES